MIWQSKEPDIVEKVLVVIIAVLILAIGFYVTQPSDGPEKHGVTLELSDGRWETNDTVRATLFENLSRSEQQLYRYALRYEGAPLTERRVSAYVPDGDAFANVTAVRRGKIVREVTVLERGQRTNVV
jgi:hypothetical protein